MVNGLETKQKESRKESSKMQFPLFDKFHQTGKRHRAGVMKMEVIIYNSLKKSR